jgi:predicted negative regulator of RcsB-dependent stress response
MGDEPREDKPRNALSGMLSSIGAVVTLVLTVWNAHTKNQIDEASRQIEDRRTRVEESKERVERYKFVLSTLDHIATRDSTDRLVALSIARLALDPTEAADLFDRLAVSHDSSLRQLGRQGAAQEQAAAQRNPTEAARLERAGYSALINGDVRAAADSFARADQLYPTYHQVFELSRYLRRQAKLPAPPLSVIATQVLDSLSKYATEDERRGLREKAK